MAPLGVPNMKKDMAPLRVPYSTLFLKSVVRFDSSRVATRHSSPTPHFDQGCDSTIVKSNYIPHSRLYIVVYEPSQRAAFIIPVKSVSFKSSDYRRHRACAIARLVELYTTYTTILRQIERCPKC